MARSVQMGVLLLSTIAVIAVSDARRLLVNTAAYGYQDPNTAGVQSSDSTSYQAQQQPAAASSTDIQGQQQQQGLAGSGTSFQAQQQPMQKATTASSSSSDSLPSFELPSLPQIKAFFDSLPKPPSLGPGPFDALFGPAPAPAPTMAFAPMATSG